MVDNEATASSSVCPQGCDLQAASPLQQDRVTMGSSR